MSNLFLSFFFVLTVHPASPYAIQKSQECRSSTTGSSIRIKRGCPGTLQHLCGTDL